MATQTVGDGKISVLMGIYNCAPTLPDALDSILAQTYDNWELILCDDCSTDCTWKVASSYAEKYPDKIILLKNEKNSRLAFTLNHCLAHATGEFVARMDGDDKCVPERFAKQVAFLRAHEDIVLVGTAMQRFYDSGTTGAVVTCPAFPDRYTPHTHLAFHHATVLAYKWVFDALGGYTVSPRTVRGQDRDLWYRFFHAGYRGANMSEPLYWVREDVDAIRRRTAKDRWISYQTTLYGYRLLHYPLHWYIRPTMELAKVLVPTWGVLQYRAWQKRREEKQMQQQSGGSGV